MWIKHMPCGDLINLNVMSKIYKDKVKIFGEYPDGSKIVIGEFWTSRECENILRSIQLVIGAEGFIIVRDTRSGMTKLKRSS